MPKAPPPPTEVEFSIANERSLKREKWSGPLVAMVALVSALISLFALRYVGLHIGLGPYLSWGLPIAVDGFAIACSLGIARANDVGEGLRGSWSEWVGLLLALGVSLMGNVWHGLRVALPGTPDALVWVYAAVPPLLLAYGVHVWGRAVTKGLSAHVLASDPTKLQLNHPTLGQTLQAATARPAPAAARPAPAAPTAQPSTRREALAQSRTPARTDVTVDVRAHAAERTDARAQAATPIAQPSVNMSTPERTHGAPTPRTPAGVVAAQGARTPAEPRKLTPEESAHWDRVIKAEVYRRAAQGALARDDEGALNDKDGKPIASRLHVDLQVPRTPADTRRKVGDNFKEYLEQGALEAIATGDAPQAEVLPLVRTGTDSDR